MSKTHKNVIVIFTVFLIIGLLSSYFYWGKEIISLNSTIEKCTQKTSMFFKKMNTKIDQQLDYSFAENDSTLKALLGNKYNYISEKDNNCYALVKNYNSIINEYRYSILNADTEVLEVVLLDHDLKSSSSRGYQEEFVSKYNQLFLKE